MPKKNYKIISLLVFSILLCFFGLLLVSASTTYAVSLEVQYPRISGQTINANTKLPDYALYLFNAGIFLGYFSVFISLIIAGIMYFLSPAKPDLRSSAKDRVSGAISGLLILVLTYLIVTTINPQLSVFKLTELPEVEPITETETTSPGVYFYKESGCSDDSVKPNTTNVLDFVELRNKVNYAGIVQDAETKTSYVSILYDHTNLWGKCQYLDPNNPCQTAVDKITGKPFADSASVYAYNFDSGDDGIYFYRKSCFNRTNSSSVTDLIENCNENSGGYYKIKSPEDLIIKKLDEMVFSGEEDNANNPDDCTVPELERDCTMYLDSGNCMAGSFKCPNLAGENISSMIIHGDYLVLFFYFGPGDKAYGPWTSCQEFPIPSDINKLGPQQIKWENIRNTGGVIPNYVMIIPIQR